jgi:hypothetical protein
MQLAIGGVLDRFGALRPLLRKRSGRRAIVVAER